MVGDGVGEEDEKRDVQKKITRWSSGAGVLEELFPRQRLPVEMKPGGLVVVASLLTKIPNLGGVLTFDPHLCINFVCVANGCGVSRCCDWWL